MAGEVEKRRRQEIKRRLREQERAELLAGLPMSLDELRQLISHIDRSLEQQPCDHSNRHLEEWLGEHRIDKNAASDWFRERGGYCDCEIAMNIPGNYFLADIFE